MDVFGLRETVVGQYADYIRSFLRIKDPAIEAYVAENLNKGRYWPDPLVQLNPSFEPGDTVDELVAAGVLAEGCRRIFRRNKDANGLGDSLRLHRHQQDAIEVARSGGSYVLTTGTGSGKSLAYFIPIVDHVLRHGSRKGIKAIVIYPMNALCNSQLQELEKYLTAGFGPGGEPVTYARYTGQESQEERAAIAANPPDILLTNFMMLELLLTRTEPNDRQVIKAAAGLEFLVLDELHTYRGRQGADVAMLVRRVRERCGAPTMRCVGTSATLAAAGTREERQTAVAAVASRLFGDVVLPSSVIGETLRPVAASGVPTTPEALRASLTGAPEYAADFETLSAHPLTAWVETAFGVQRDDLGRLERRTPITLAEGARQLAAFTGVPEAACGTHLQALLMAGYGAHRPDTGLPLFAFRLHQFISRGDTVHASIEAPESRHLALEGQVYVPGDRERRLYPLAFCRECGQEYYLVELHDGEQLEPRDLGAVSHKDRSDSRSGFLFVGNWTETIENYPEDWLEAKKNGDIVVKSANKDWRPVAITVSPDGRCATQGLSGGVEAWFQPAPFRFCLSCGVSYASATRSDFGKLASLSTEGRSTATTVLSLSIVRALRTIESLGPKARKLLSFTDNRQDASLQAGHFNDFIQVGLLRGALYAAVAAAGPRGLDHDVVTQRVADAIGLEFGEFASNPEAQFMARNGTIKALRDVVGYRIYCDLRRGWRVTSPNLEQCGLLAVSYEALDELCAAEECWKDRHDVLRGATPQQRLRACRVVLDTMRRALAIKVRFLDHDQQEAISNASFQFLRDPWAFEEGEELVDGAFFRVRGHGGKPYGREVSVSATSGLGRYLRRPSTWPSSQAAGAPLPAGELEPLAEDLFEVLCIGGQVEKAERGAVPLYQLQAGAIHWLVGDGTPPQPDPVTVPRPPRRREQVETNAFFRQFYTSIALSLHGTEAREHTAQVPAEIRQEREAKFRDGELPVLYCSPTMELGVDIAELNAVNMRNVPPTPANYAQRSGRAGRQGQPALVLTYCSSTSPHDQYFFRRQERMVAGAVSPPRLDLANEDLVRAHLHAVWLAETEQYLGQSLKDVVDLERMTPERLPLRDTITAGLSNPHARRRAAVRCETILRALSADLEGAAWYRPGWLASVMDGALLQFNRACDRWRGLYLSACQQRDQQHAIIVDASTCPEARTAATRLRAEAETQIKLLVDEGKSLSSDFSPYRYFASEGFLPGYNFPRLPLAAYLPGKSRKTGRDEFVSRPRFLAVSEFGPRSIIYHEGNRYRVNRVILPAREDDEKRTTEAKFCLVCGYGHFGLDSQAEVCHSCGVLLTGGDYLNNLLRLDNVSTRRVDRITSDEEERLRQGYEIHTAIRFAQSTQGTLADHVDYLGPDPADSTRTAVVAHAVFAPTATIWRLNFGWNRRKVKGTRGFLLDMEKGYWSKKDNPTETTGEGVDDPAGDAILQRVVPFVEDRRNALVLWFESALRLEQIVSLSYALKRGIENRYQLESSEIAVDLLPSGADPRRILFYEASEGGAGVLSRLVQEPGALAGVARDALEICHFDPQTGEDLHDASGAAEQCEAACYNCLLAYGNQREHKLLDRHGIAETLRALSGVSAKAVVPCKDVDSLLQGLLLRCGSELERRFIRYLAEHELRLPDKAQLLIEQIGTRPDFTYTDPNLQACVYVDGPFHQFPERAARDAVITLNLQDAGYTVVRVQGDDSWPAAVHEYAWVFGAGL